MERQKSVNLKGMMVDKKGRIVDKRTNLIRSRLALAEKILGGKEFPAVRDEERARTAIREAKSLIFEAPDDALNVKKIGELEKGLTRNRRNIRSLEHKMAFARRIADNLERTDSEKEEAKEALGEARELLKQIRNQIVEAIDMPGHVGIVNFRDKKLKEIIGIEIGLNRKPEKKEETPFNKDEYSLAGHQC